MSKSETTPDNRAICPDCGGASVMAVAVDDPFFGLDLRYPGLECESCGWGSP